MIEKLKVFQESGREWSETFQLSLHLIKFWFQECWSCKSIYIGTPLAQSIPLISITVCFRVNSIFVSINYSVDCTSWHVMMNMSFSWDFELIFIQRMSIALSVCMCVCVCVCVCASGLLFGFLLHRFVGGGFQMEWDYVDRRESFGNRNRILGDVLKNPSAMITLCTGSRRWFELSQKASLTVL